MTLRPPVLGLFALAAAAALLPGCRGMGPGAATGTAMGTILGGGVGYAVGRHNSHRAAGTAIGAAIGGLSGYALGSAMDDADRGRYRTYDDRSYDDGYYGYGPPVVRERVYVEPYRERVIVRERRVYHAPPPRYVVREYRDPYCW